MNVYRLLTFLFEKSQIFVVDSMLFDDENEAMKEVRERSLRNPDYRYSLMCFKPESAKLVS